MALQDKYLGVPLLIQKNKVDTFGHLSEKFGNRMDLWNGKHLNQLGRTVLAQTVLGSVASHHLSFFSMPKVLTDKFERFQRNFVLNKNQNGRSLKLIKWKTVAQPKVLGGLNLKKTEVMNISGLLNWKTPPSSQFVSSSLQTIDQLIDHDNKSWRLDILTPLFNNATVNDILNIRISTVGEDQLRWTPADNGLLSVKTTYRVLDTVNRNASVDHMVNLFPWNKFWKSVLPPEIMHFIWKCVHGCLPVSERLARYVADINPKFPFYDRENETVQHLLIDCDVFEAIRLTVNILILQDYAVV
ncbi:uncharacterized protein LOC113294145 [Papaver somniferum]|uniref:uncharacterized protein LOC113294145 n=1 Tax=Papaver somniferum TaxID=3469 RepID=UPI000E6F6C8B|nr:uncharacterized protein LOC113294145 [Papaver somniferum]